MAAPCVTDDELFDARLLLVDDQPTNLQLLEQMLASAGYRDVRSTSQPRQVLDLHREHDFDLIVLDLQMPGMDGFEVMDQLRSIERDPYLPVLVLTAQPSQKLRALQAGARDFVGKPFDVVELQTRIRNMVEVRLLHRRLAFHNERLELAVQERTAELRESEERFKRLVELATDWYWEQDAEGRFTRVSAPALELLGMAEPDAVAWVADATSALDAKLAARLPFLDFVYRRTMPDGAVQVLQASGEPSFDATGRFLGYRGIGTDVTAREGADAASVATLRRFREALEEGGPAIVLRDAGSLRIVDANRTACTLSGQSRGQLLELAAGALEPGGESALRASVQRLAAGGAVEHGPSRIMRGDGNSVAVERSRYVHGSGAEALLVDMMHAREASG